MPEYGGEQGRGDPAPTVFHLRQLGFHNLAIACTGKCAPGVLRELLIHGFTAGWLLLD